MSKLNKIFLVLIIVLLTILGAVVYWQKFGCEQPYYAGYLDTGDIYFGKSLSPIGLISPIVLTDVWFLQQNPQNTENPFSLSKFNDAFWGPENRMELNYKKIIWLVKLRQDSQALEYIKNN